MSDRIRAALAALALGVLLSGCVPAAAGGGFLAGASMADGEEEAVE